MRLYTQLLLVLYSYVGPDADGNVMFLVHGKKARFTRRSIVGNVDGMSKEGYETWTDIFFKERADRKEMNDQFGKNRVEFPYFLDFDMRLKQDVKNEEKVSLLKKMRVWTLLCCLLMMRMKMRQFDLILSLF